MGDQKEEMYPNKILNAHRTFNLISGNWKALMNHTQFRVSLVQQCCHFRIKTFPTRFLKKKMEELLALDIKFYWNSSKPSLCTTNSPSVLQMTYMTPCRTF